MKRFRQAKSLGIIALALAITLIATSCIRTAPPSSLPASGNGMLNLWDTGPYTLDPAISSELTSHTYVMQVFSGLVRLDEHLKPAPDIAESWGRNPNGKTYTFHLRRDARFHDGTEVTAHDFKYSWERACNPRTGSQTASSYLIDIVGARDVLEGKSREISGVRVIDDHTLEVTIDAPKAYFLAKLAYPTAFVVQKANVDTGREWWRKSNGTGPFKVTEWREGQLLVLEPSNYHWQAPLKISKVAFHLLAGMPMAMYETGAIDVVPVFGHFADKVTDKNGPFYKELAISPELSLFYAGFNTTKPPFDDANVRKAFCHAVNKERIIKLILKGMSIKANGILPVGMPGYNENLRGLDYDPAKAMSLIAASEYKSPENLPPITVTTSGEGGDIPDYLGAIIQDWKQNLGIEVTVRQLEMEIFSQPLTLKQELDDIFISGWIADYPDPQNFLDILFHSKADYNSGNYTNTEVDSLLDQAAIEMNETDRLGMYQKAEQIMIEDAACLPLWFNTNYVLIKPYVKNYKLNALGIPSLTEVYIER
ncbi:MAG: peptide ABC transporter substrate-binding protein [Chloroflexi bacterium]|nr:peptide ABC transporter substrate-binding protein [Chloroflexota bacterium]MBM3172803.1 peptide ABC transporter substrate-binding protein [Chloroflexota bacterium]MBM3175463.1 peptide ABC transporter substrate-binding protein [Chloroflexota bacterium]MBM4450063.1 peptide ABC transporter substrate-binding protein [Chloroflexota bacterium]